MKKHLLFIVAASAIIIMNVSAQEETKTFKPSFNWKGFTHIWTGYGQNDTLLGHSGFAVRYLRFKAYGNLAENVKWTAQFAFDKGQPSLVDLFIAYEPFEFLKVQFGQFPVPGAKSGVLSTSIWSTTKMMFIDRSTITQNWASNAGLKGYRSGGAMLYGSFLEKKLNYYLMAAMSMAGPNNYFNPSVKSPLYSHDEDGLAMFSRLEIRPIDKLEVGANYHLGVGVTDDTTATGRGSFSAYVLTRQEKLFVMAEYIAGAKVQTVNDVKDSESSYNGYYIELAYKLARKYEPAIRFDSYIPVIDGSDKEGFKKYNNLTIGFNYYPHKNIALMGNYVVRMETPDTGMDEIKNDLFYIQLRYLFSSN